MAETEQFPDMETGQKLFIGLYYDALSRLARQGFAVQPADAEDLIQDFYADAWTGLAARYNAACGSPSAYVYGAFLRFARIRILKLQRRQPRRQDLSRLADLIAQQGALPPLEKLVRQEEAEAVQRALAELAPLKRTLLLEYLAAGPRSERRMARDLQISRFQLHGMVIDALGELMLRLGEGVLWPADDRAVAVALWSESRSVAETAAHLGLTVAQVREARHRLERVLAAALASGQAGGFHGLVSDRLP
jgi:RNA polymerase sigma factor (sigma-70 family)